MELLEAQKNWHATVKAYVIGFILSLLLTLTSFFLVSLDLSHKITLYSIVSLAILQAIVQLLFFFHITKTTKPDWQNLMLSCMLSVLLIIVIGSLWIIHDLNKRAMSNMTMEAHD